MNSNPSTDMPLPVLCCCSACADRAPTSLAPGRFSGQDVNQRVPQDSLASEPLVRRSGADHPTAHKLQCLRMQHLIRRVDIGAIPCEELNYVQMTFECGRKKACASCLRECETNGPFILGVLLACVYRAC